MPRAGLAVDERREARAGAASRARARCSGGDLQPPVSRARGRGGSGRVHRTSSAPAGPDVARSPSSLGVTGHSRSGGALWHARRSSTSPTVPGTGADLQRLGRCATRDRRCSTSTRKTSAIFSQRAACSSKPASTTATPSPHLTTSSATAAGRACCRGDPGRSRARRCSGARAPASSTARSSPPIGPATRSRCATTTSMSSVAPDGRPAAGRAHTGQRAYLVEVAGAVADVGGGRQRVGADRPALPRSRGARARCAAGSGPRLATQRVPARRDARPHRHGPRSTPCWPRDTRRSSGHALRRL